MRLASQALAMEVEQVVLVALSTHKVSSDAISLSHRRLMSIQRVWEEDKEGMVAESATIKCKVSAPAVRLVSTEGACETCKKVGVVTKCVYGTGAACARCKSAKLAQGRHGQRKPTEAAGSSAMAADVVETTKSKSTLSVFPSLTHRFDRWEDSLAVSQGQPQQKGSFAHRG